MHNQKDSVTFHTKSGQLIVARDVGAPGSGAAGPRLCMSLPAISTTDSASSGLEAFSPSVVEALTGGLQVWAPQCNNNTSFGCRACMPQTPACRSRDQVAHVLQECGLRAGRCPPSATSCVLDGDAA